MDLIAETAGRLVDDGQEFVLATILSRQGSTPRTAGTRMIITADGRNIGTIGGGMLEARVIEKAGEVLSTRRPVIMPFDMKPSDMAAMDMICGGALEVLLEFVDPGSPASGVFKAWRDVQGKPQAGLFLTVIGFAGENVATIKHCLLQNQQVVSGEVGLDAATLRQLAGEHGGAACLRTVALDQSIILVEPVLPAETVFLFGAGHVAQPTARLAAYVGFRVRVVDDRTEFANAERFPEAEEIRVVAGFDDALQTIPIDCHAFIVIVTRGHLHDQTVLMQALRTEAGYIGMIGSRRKCDHIFNALLKQGFTAGDLKRVHAPIGLAIAAETPEEIALSIVAEMVKVRAEGRCA
jgi:xanthine dehydrogenase accessory factor